jgi:hypothetical protein
MTESTIVTPRGWWDLADAAAFYPSDLPEDWRLTYFANQFGATLLPWSLWDQAGTAAWSQWADDVGTGFRFVAETGSATNAARAQADLQHTLGHALSAWLASDRRLDAQRDDGEPSETHQIPCWPATLNPPAEYVSGDTNTYAAVAPAALHRDLRSARRWLEELRHRNAQPPAVVILARPASETLTAWQQLVELLGLDPA